MKKFPYVWNIQIVASFRAVCSYCIVIFESFYILAGAGAGLMLAGADSPLEALSMGGGMLGGAALGSA